MRHKSHLFAELTRRERQIMEVIYQHGSATGAKIREQMPDPPSYATVRTILRVLETKGHVRHNVVQRRFVYRPRASAKSLRCQALTRLVKILFDGSVAEVFAMLLGPPFAVSRDELERVGAIVEAFKARIST